MSCRKRKLDAKDDVYSGSYVPKRICSSDDSCSSSFSESLSSSAPEQERNYTDEERKRVLAILENEFDRELEAKEKEVIEIQKRIQKTQKVLQYLCYAVVSDFYSREKTISSVVGTRQRRIHPAVKKLLSGKAPAGMVPSTSSNLTYTASVDCEDKDRNSQLNSDSHIGFEESSEKKVPRYIPPKPKNTNYTASSEPIRGGKNKVRTLLLVGNVSKWIPPDSREDAVTHKWMVYVRGPKEAPDISKFVSKVRFFLHPSYRPNDVVQVVCPPFQLSRRGWGEFPVRVQIHFTSPLNKPVDIIHNLKLDRTYSGLQTLGAETIAEVWIQRDDLLNDVQIINQDPPTSENCEDVVCEQLGFSDQSLTPSTAVKNEPKSPDPSLDLDEQPNSSSTIKPEKPDGDESSSLNMIGIPGETSEDNAFDLNRRGDKQEPFVISTVPEKNDSALAKSSKIESVHSPSSIKNQIISQSSLPINDCKLSANSVECNAEDVTKPCITPTNESNPVVTPPSATRLVKCVDSKGTVRLVKMSADVLTKLLKSNNANVVKQIPTPTSGAASGPQKILSTSTSGAALGPQKILSTSDGVSSSLQVSQMMAAPLQKSATPPNSPSPSKIQPLPGVRPVLRLLRPPGGAGVLSNPGSQPTAQPPMVARFAAPSNGDRPVLVLKDGKLFLMKSIVNTSTAISSGVTSTTNAFPVGVLPSTPSTTLSSGIQPEKLQKALNATCQIDSSTAQGTHTSSALSTATSIVRPSKPSAMTSVITSVSPKATLSMTEPVINGGNLQKPVMLRNSPSLNLSPRSVNVSSSLKSQSPVSAAQSTVVIKSKCDLESDQGLQTKKNGSRSVTLVSNSPVHLSKPLTPVTSRSIIKPGRSLLKSGISLLKTNVASNASSLNGALTSRLAVVSSSPQSTVLKSSVPVLPCASITTTPHRAQQYQKQLSQAVCSCPRGDNESVWRAIRWMMRYFPLIHNEAHENDYKILHPYCAPSEKVFRSWNIGKQRACEWLRAKAVRQSLVKAGWEAQSVWTTREIVLWARFHGYTPGLLLEDEKDVKSSFEDEENENNKKKIDPFLVCEYSEPTTAEKWIQAQENPSTLNRSFMDSKLAELDEEIDIVNCDTSPSKVIKGDMQSTSSSEPLDEMPFEPSTHVLGQMVSDTLKRCGLKNLSSEEICPGVRYPAALRMIVQAVQSLVEDLTRRAFADAWGENVAKQPSNLDVKNICGAILNRPELDMFTCSGLGTRSDPHDAKNLK